MKAFCRSHPILIACFTSAIMAAAVTELFFVDLINKTQGWESDNITIAFRIIVLLAIPTLWWAAIKATKPITLLLVASLIFGVPKAKAAPALAIGAILVVVIGGVVGCKIVKRCKKIAKARDARLTNESPFVVAGEVPESAALMTWIEGDYCAEERLLPSVPTVFTMCPTFPSFPGDSMKILTHADTGYEFTETWSGFEAEVASHDLFLSQPVSYSRNGHRCEAEQSLISFSTNRVAKIGRGGLLVTVERSEDLKTWEPMFKINVEPWMSLRIEDVSEDHQAYRITISAP